MVAIELPHKPLRVALAAIIRGGNATDWLFERLHAARRVAPPGGACFVGAAGAPRVRVVRLTAAELLERLYALRAAVARSQRPAGAAARVMHLLVVDTEAPLELRHLLARHLHPAVVVAVRHHRHRLWPAAVALPCPLVATAEPAARACAHPRESSATHFAVASRAARFNACELAKVEEFRAAGSAVATRGHGSATAAGDSR